MSTQSPTEEQLRWELAQARQEIERLKAEHNSLQQRAGTDQQTQALALLNARNPRLPGGFLQ
jgi:hypothetical protein